jgi:hypothetical protein
MWADHNVCKPGNAADARGERRLSHGSASSSGRVHERVLLAPCFDNQSMALGSPRAQGMASGLQGERNPRDNLLGLTADMPPCLCPQDIHSRMQAFSERLPGLCLPPSSFDVYALAGFSQLSEVDRMSLLWPMKRVNMLKALSQPCESMHTEGPGFCMLSFLSLC